MIRRERERREKEKESRWAPVAHKWSITHYYYWPQHYYFSNNRPITMTTTSTTTTISDTIDTWMGLACCVYYLCRWFFGYLRNHIHIYPLCACVRVCQLGQSIYRPHKIFTLIDVIGSAAMWYDTSKCPCVSFERMSFTKFIARIQFFWMMEKMRWQQFCMKNVSV